MNTPRFNVFLSVGDARHAQVWEARQPMQLGQALPWTLEMTDDEIRLIHASGLAFPLAPEVVKSGSEIELREPENQSGLGVSLRLEVAPDLRPAFARELPDEAARKRFRVFTCQGDWVLDSKPVPAHFVAGSRRRRRPVFTLDHRDGHYLLKLRDASADIHGLEEAELMGGSQEKGGYKLTWQQLEKLTVISDTVQWRFRLVAESEALALQNVPAAAPDPETLWFGKARRWGLATLALMLALMWIAPTLKPEEPEKEPQFARIVITKHEIFAAAKADRAERQEVAKTVAPPSAPGESAPAPEKAVAENKPAERKLMKQAATTPAKNARSAAKALASADRARPDAPAKPSVNRALRQAQALAAAMGGLAPDSASSGLLATAEKAAGKGDHRTAAALWGERERKGAGGGREPSAAALLGRSNVQVAMTGNQKGGEGDGNAGAGYGAGKHGAGIKGSGGSFVQVSISDETPGMSEEGLTKQEVWEVINKHLSEVKYCYERAIIRRPDAQGKLVVAFTIGAPGSVKKTAVKSSSLGDPQLDQCIVGRLTTWKFPKPRGGIDVNVLYPFIFKRL
jgi:outer membrane biosynthesis protein TonB